jgi:hypothetical protein
MMFYVYHSRRAVSRFRIALVIRKAAEIVYNIDTGNVVFFNSWLCFRLFDAARWQFRIWLAARLTSSCAMGGNLDLSCNIWLATHCSIFSSFLALHPSNVAASKQNKCTELGKGLGSMARTGRRESGQCWALIALSLLFALKWTAKNNPHSESKTAVHGVPRSR